MEKKYDVELFQQDENGYKPFWIIQHFNDKMKALDTAVHLEKFFSMNDQTAVHLRVLEYQETNPGMFRQNAKIIFDIILIEA